jgi:hypothetical protein
VRLHWVEGGHDPKAGADGEICEVVADWIATL